MNETIINITNVTSEQKTNITFIEILIYTWIFMCLLSYIDKNKGKSQRKSRFTEKKALNKKKNNRPIVEKYYWIRKCKRRNKILYGLH